MPLWLLTRVQPDVAHHPRKERLQRGEIAQAHLAVEKGDKLGTVIVDCAR